MYFSKKKFIEYVRIYPERYNCKFEKRDTHYHLISAGVGFHTQIRLTEKPIRIKKILNIHSRID